MEKIKKLLAFLAPLPRWARILVVVVIATVVAVVLSSCGVTRAVVHNGATGTSTEIKITTSNPTTVTATPNVTITNPSNY